jgi:hypothetical protein
MQSTISNPKLSIKEVGKFIKTTKLLFIWEFYIAAVPYEIKLYHSKVSRKRRILLGEKLLHESREGVFKTNFKYEFEEGGVNITILQVGANLYDISIHRELTHESEIVKNESVESSLDLDVEEYKELENYYIPQSVPVDKNIHHEIDLSPQEAKFDLFPDFDNLIVKPNNVNLMEFEKDAKRPINDMLNEIVFMSSDNRLAPFTQDVQVYKN